MHKIRSVFKIALLLSAISYPGGPVYSSQSVSFENLDFSTKGLLLFEMDKEERKKDEHNKVRYYDKIKSAQQAVEFTESGEAVFSLTKNAVPQGKYIWVMNEKGKIFLESARTLPAKLHSQLARGGLVAAAGEIEFNQNSRIKLISNRTGHYKVAPFALLQFLRTLEDFYQPEEMPEILSCERSGSEYSCKTTFLPDLKLRYQESEYLPEIFSVDHYSGRVWQKLENGDLHILREKGNYFVHAKNGSFLGRFPEENRSFYLDDEVQVQCDPDLGRTVNFRGSFSYDDDFNCSADLTSGSHLNLANTGNVELYTEYGLLSLSLNFVLTLTLPTGEKHVLLPNGAEKTIF